MSALTRDQKAFKALTRYLTDECGGATASSQLLGGKSASLISCYGNQNDASEHPRFMPLDDIATLEHYAGRSIVGAWLVERSKADRNRPRPIFGMQHLCHITKEGGEAKSVMARVLNDALQSGDITKISAADRAEALRELREAHAAYGLAIEALEAGE
jgi:hypothetical protein